MTTESTDKSSVSTIADSTKYLTFKVADEAYGVEVLKVREIIGLLPITKIPKAPPYILGVINLRGKVIPVADTTNKFGINPSEKTDETCIIVVEVAHSEDSIEMGILVDKVLEVTDIYHNEIEQSVQFGTSIKNEFITGIAKVEDGIKILLDIDQLLASEEVADFSEQIVGKVEALDSENTAA